MRMSVTYSVVLLSVLGKLWACSWMDFVVYLVYGWALYLPSSTSVESIQASLIGWQYLFWNIFKENALYYIRSWSLCFWTFGDCALFFRPGYFKVLWERGVSLGNVVLLTWPLTLLYIWNWFVGFVHYTLRIFRITYIIIIIIFLYTKFLSNIVDQQFFTQTLLPIQVSIKLLFQVNYFFPD